MGQHLSPLFDSEKTEDFRFFYLGLDLINRSQLRSYEWTRSSFRPRFFWLENLSSPMLRCFNLYSFGRMESTWYFLGASNKKGQYVWVRRLIMKHEYPKTSRGNLFFFLPISPLICLYTLQNAVIGFRYYAYVLSNLLLVRCRSISFVPSTYSTIVCLFPWATRDS